MPKVHVTTRCRMPRVVPARVQLEGFPPAAQVRGATLDLQPLEVAHARELSELLDDPRLHTFIGGTPANEQELTERYRHQVVGRSPDGSQRWLNWVLRRRQDDQVVGTVQATIASHDGLLVADVAWVVATAYQGQGYATEAAASMVQWLRARGVDLVRAYIRPEHRASQGVARALGLARTGATVDGEEQWVDAPRPAG